MRTIVLSCVAALTAGVLVPTASAAARPVVVELFTSQGCSSCPPADAYLVELAERGDVLALAFHVTYWNALGWRDPFSFEGATARQAAYAVRLGGGSFTPEMVVDGRRGLVGSARGEVANAIAASAATASDAVALRVSRTGDTVQIDVGAGHGAGRILLIGFDHRRVTPVGRGENGGSTLTEANIVRSFRSVGDYRGTPLHLTQAAGAGDGTAVLVQSDDGKIIAAARP